MDSFYEQLEAAGHRLIRDEDGEIDAFAMASGFHNGPRCELCHEAWCEHCEEKVEPCDGGAAHAAYIAKRDREEWERLIATYGPEGPAS